jgi:hypothetical protein
MQRSGQNNATAKGQLFFVVCLTALTEIVAKKKKEAGITLGKPQFYQNRLYFIFGQ